MEEIANTTSMRVLGAFVILATVIQIGVASAAYNMTSWNVGSWWSGVLCFITAICALLSNNKGVVTAGCVLSVISILLSIAGVVLDGVFYGVTNALATCVNQETGEYYGDTQYSLLADQCKFGHSETCLCVQGNSGDTCFLFDLKAANNCGQILTKLPSLLLASMLFLLLSLILVFTYSIFTCMGVCCVKTPGANPPLATTSSV